MYRVYVGLLCYCRHNGNPDKIELKKQIGMACFGTVYQGMYKGEEITVKKIKIPAGISKEMVLKNSRELAALK